MKHRRTESVTSVPAHSQVKEERRLEVGSVGDILRGMNSIDHSVTTAFSTLLSIYGYGAISAVESALWPSGLSEWDKELIA